ncbi:30S ribosomal protein S1 [Planctomycetes bacterium Poly30]|uniref:30S ribosomal protein S1 n=1 Tax=Saltatorellus ferox TaxID=2528018 RepID=A0A518ETP6_9BACT|nr:30S ribosomal protein S1 [Planctomycetes bacterium Poly30]
MSNDSLDKEIEDALNGVDLQALGARPEDDSPSAGGKRRSKSDDLMPGTVSGISGDDVVIDLGPRMQGICALTEFDEPPAVGQEFRFMNRGRDDDDLWILSLRGAKDLEVWEQLEVGSHTKARVTGQNQGGLTLKIGGNEAFMPMSQVSIQRDVDASSLLGETIVCEVMEIDRSRNRVLLSRRRVEEGERMVALSEAVGNLTPGSKVKGKVTRIEAFGAFVNIGHGVEGLVHVSQISRQRVEKVDEVLKVGQDVDAMILEIKEGGKKISLGMKQLEPDPWDEVPHRLSVDSQITGKVTRLMDFGAFVEVMPGIEGLLHVSQISTERIQNISRVLNVGQEVTVRVSAVDPGSQRISLTRLDARGAMIGSEDAVDNADIQAAMNPSAKPLGTNLGDLFKKALENKK